MEVNINFDDYTPGEGIQKARKILGLSQKEMAEKIGVSRPTLIGYEKGVRDISVVKYNQIMDMLKDKGI